MKFCITVIRQPQWSIIGHFQHKYQLCSHRKVAQIVSKVIKKSVLFSPVTLLKSKGNSVSLSPKIPHLIPTVLLSVPNLQVYALALLYTALSIENYEQVALHAHINQDRLVNVNA